jgi:hypothetical protein
VSNILVVSVCLFAGGAVKSSSGRFQQCTVRALRES